MSLRSLRYWMSQSSFRSIRHPKPYRGPTEGAVLLTDGTLIRVPLDYATGSQALNQIDADQIEATFLHLSLQDWNGEAEVPDLDGHLYIVNTSVCATLEEAVVAIRAKKAETLAELAETKAHPDRELKERLEQHDWYGHMSDSFAASEVSDRNMVKILALVQQVPMDTARALWAKYAPNGDFACPV